MNADERRGEEVLPLNLLTERIIGCAMRVSSTLGCGFLEKVYENALAHEMGKAGLSFAAQRQVNVVYDGVVVGDYIADFVVDERVIVELKAVKGLDDVHVAQTINYLRATGFHVGLLFNFGRPKLQVKRLVHQL